MGRVEREHSRKRNDKKTLLDDLKKVLSPVDARDQVDTVFFGSLSSTLIRIYNNKEISKLVYFYLVMVLSIFVVVGAGVMVWVLANKPEENTAAIISSIGCLLGTLFGVPLIIAKYLFSENEVEVLTKLLENIRKNDMMLRMKENEKEKVQERAAIVATEEINEEVTL